MSEQIELGLDGVPIGCKICGAALESTLVRRGLCGACLLAGEDDEAPPQSYDDARPRRPTRRQLSIPEFVDLFAQVQSGIAEALVGNARAGQVLAFELVRHVAMIPTLGPRLLALGESGSGKSALVEAGWKAIPIYLRPPLEVIPAGGVTADGWGSATNVAEVFSSGRIDPRAVLVIDNTEALTTRPYGADEIGRSHYGNVWRSLGRVILGHAIRSSQGAQVPTAGLCVIVTMGRPDEVPEAAAAFDTAIHGSPLTPSTLERLGMPPNVSAVLAGRALAMQTPSVGDVVTILARWPEVSELVKLATDLGFPVEITPSAVAALARGVASGVSGFTARAAGSLLVGALRQAILDRLAASNLHDPIVISPDDVVVGLPRRVR